MSVWRRYVLCLPMLLAARLPAQLAARAVQTPVGVAYDAAGNLYFSDVDRHQVFEATLAGALLIVAGDGVQGYSGDGGAATAAELNEPQALVFGGDGTLYIADTGNNVVRAVSGGIITTFAGTGTLGYTGDGGAATAAKLAWPNALVMDASGALLMADSGNHRVRRVAGGVIATIAGNGAQGFSGDGGAATAAMLDTPSGIAVGANGVVYIADTHNQRVRAVSAVGVITTVGGTGIAGYAGDGGAATIAELDSPRGLTVQANGTLLIADADNQRVRSVAADGTISTVAGGAVQGAAADGVVATVAALNTPKGVGFGGFAWPVIADGPNHTLRVVANGQLYVPAALAAGRTTTVALSAGTPAVVTVTGAVGIPQGSVSLTVDGIATTGVLSDGSASFALGALTPGSHALQASYAGDGLNPTAASGVVTVTGAKAASSVVTQPPVQNSYAGLPLLLHAEVMSATSGTPTGIVNFMEGSAPVATAQLASGIASGVYLAPAAGTHLITASYMGDENFLPSVSPGVMVVVQALPDFAIAVSGSASQTVAAGAIAIYGFSVSPQGGAFSGAVSLSVSGLPEGATASFAPPQVVPGAASVASTLSVQTLAVTARSWRGDGMYVLLLLPVLLWRRRLRGVAVVCCVLFALAGCGTRINQPPSADAGSYTLTVTATGTNLAGVVVTHSTTVALQVQ